MALVLINSLRLLKGIGMLIKIAKECIVRGACLAAGVALIGVLAVAPYIFKQNE